jgi:hypothetical protein
LAGFNIGQIVVVTSKLIPSDFFGNRNRSAEKRASRTAAQVALAWNPAEEYKRIMKKLLKVSALLVLVFALTCLAVGMGLGLAGAVSLGSGGVHLDGVPRPLGAAFGLFIAAVAVVFALAVTVVALAGAFLAMLLALLLTGLILLAVALPFLLPLIIPLAVVFVVVLATRHSSRSRAV